MPDGAAFSREARERRFEYYSANNLIRPPNAVPFFESVFSCAHNIYEVDSPFHLFTVGLSQRELLLTVEEENEKDEKKKKKEKLSREQLVEVMRALVTQASNIFPNQNLSGVKEKKKKKNTKQKSK